MERQRLHHKRSFLLTGLLLGLAACTSLVPPLETAAPPTQGTQPATSPPTDSPDSVPGTAAIGDEEAIALMYGLLESDTLAAEAAIRKILDADDRRFVAVFLELQRAAQIGLVQTLGYARIIEALETLSGQAFGGSWPDWVNWYGATDLVPPPGFTGWKGTLLSRIDPGFGEFLQDQYPPLIRVEEIQWGGVRVDGIPALDNPAMISPEEAEYLQPWDPVFGVAINGDARAYPLRILDWHEMANDIVGGVPVSLAYCTLCGAAIAYDGRASDGTTYTFGSSGFLFRSNKLMYDRQTRTLWNQLTGEPVLGPLTTRAEDELPRLELLPVVLTAWQEWLAQHPETVVLDENTGYNRQYTPGAAYGGYFASSETMFPVWQRDDLLDTKAQVYALRIDGVPKAYPLATLTDEQVVNDVLAETPVVLVAARGSVQVDGESLREGPARYSAGGEVRAFGRGDRTFSPSQEADVLLDEGGNPWQVTEEALVGPNGEEAPRINGHLAYWFGWYAFFPNTLVYGVE